MGGQALETSGKVGAALVGLQLTTPLWVPVATSLLGSKPVKDVERSISTAAPPQASGAVGSPTAGFTAPLAGASRPTPEAYAAQAQADTALSAENAARKAARDQALVANSAQQEAQDEYIRQASQYQGRRPPEPTPTLG